MTGEETIESLKAALTTERAAREQDNADHLRAQATLCRREEEARNRATAAEERAEKAAEAHARAAKNEIALEAALATERAAREREEAGRKNMTTLLDDEVRLRVRTQARLAVVEAENARLREMIAHAVDVMDEDVDEAWLRDARAALSPDAGRTEGPSEVERLRADAAVKLASLVHSLREYLRPRLVTRVRGGGGKMRCGGCFDFLPTGADPDREESHRATCPLSWRAALSPDAGKAHAGEVEHKHSAVKTQAIDDDRALMVCACGATCTATHGGIGDWRTPEGGEGGGKR